MSVLETEVVSNVGVDLCSDTIVEMGVRVGYCQCHVGLVCS